MNNQELVNCYCFNSNCLKSIFNRQGCEIVQLHFAQALEHHCCKHCGSSLVSLPIIRANSLTSELLHFKPLKSLVIDDDYHYQRIVEKLFTHSKNFSKSTHLPSAALALEILNRHKNSPEQIPDYIFLDVHMPEMDAWEFLEEFEALATNLEKHISIFVISSHPEQSFLERAKQHSNVKAVIDKDFGLEFLDSIPVQ